MALLEADDGELKGYAKKTDVGFELLPESRDGSLVLRKAHLKVGEQEGMLLC
jgi:hypothetical protein